MHRRPNHHSVARHLGRGFTLVELMVTVGIIAILAALAAPSIQDTVDRVRSASAIDELRATFVFARSEGIRTRAQVRVVKNVGGGCNSQEWNCGWIVYADLNLNNAQDANEPTLKSVPSFDGGLIINMFKGGGQGQVVFDRWGNITPLGAMRQVVVPRGNINSQGVRTLCVSSGGRFRVVDGDASDTVCDNS